MNILVLGSRAPIAADIVRALAVGGKNRVWLADSVRFPVSRGSPYAAGNVRLPPPRDFKGFTAALVACCQKLEIGTIIPVSEEVFWVAAAAHALPAGVDIRTSPVPVLAQLHDKHRFATLAATLGYGAEHNVLLQSREDLAQVHAPERFVFKPVFSRFASSVLICPPRSELSALNPTATRPWLAQSYVAGRELCTYSVAEKGEMLMHVTYEPTFRLGSGASVYFSPYFDDKVRELCARFIAATHFTGQIGFDVIDTGEKLVAIECNPRGTSGVHLAVQDPAGLAAALLGGQSAHPTRRAPQPGMLLLPLLLRRPSVLCHRLHRQRLRAARDVLSAAGITPWRQGIALGEMLWRSIRAGLSLTEAATVDIEWNGEPIP